MWQVGKQRNKGGTGLEVKTLQWGMGWGDTCCMVIPFQSPVRVVGDRSAQPEQQEAARQVLVLQGKQEPLHPPKQVRVLQWILGIF